MQGEELALTDFFLSWEDTIDPAGCNTSPETYTQYSRDPTRTPFPWDNSTNAGFSTAAKTWLPVNTNYKQINVAAQRRMPFSQLKVFRTLTMVRREPTFTEGAVQLKVAGNSLVYTRTLAGAETFVVVLNLSEAKQTIDVATLFTGMLKPNLEVITSSVKSSLVGG